MKKDEIKPQVISKGVIEMADAIKKADEAGEQIMIIKTRRWGINAAYRLARLTDDAEIIESKQIENKL